MNILRGRQRGSRGSEGSTAKRKSLFSAWLPSLLLLPASASLKKSQAGTRQTAQHGPSVHASTAPTAADPQGEAFAAAARQPGRQTEDQSTKAPKLLLECPDSKCVSPSEDNGSIGLLGSANSSQAAALRPLRFADAAATFLPPQDGLTTREEKELLLPVTANGGFFFRASRAGGWWLLPLYLCTSCGKCQCSSSLPLDVSGTASVPRVVMHVEDAGKGGGEEAGGRQPSEVTSDRRDLPFLPTAAESGEAPANVKWLLDLAVRLLFCSCWSDTQQKASPPDEFVSLEIQRNFKYEGLGEERGRQLTQEPANSKTAPPVHEDVLLQRQQEGSSSSSGAAGRGLVIREGQRSSKQRHAAAASQQQSPPAQQTETNGTPGMQLSSSQERHSSKQSCSCRSWLFGLFSSQSEGSAASQSRMQQQQTAPMSSLWVASWNTTPDTDRRLSGYPAKIHCRSLRRIKDESRQIWMEYQEVTLDDNSKRRQWVDVGHEDGCSSGGQMSSGSVY
ncbi:hypothetical protein Efla_006395 [Eimeria flavescens]